MNFNDHKSGVYIILSSWIIFFILIIFVFIDIEITGYLVGIVLIIGSTLPFIYFFLKYRKNYLNLNPRKNNELKLLYFFRTFGGLLFGVTFNILMVLLFLLTIIIWFGTPLLYFLNSDSIYFRFCLPLLGGVIGEVIWGGIYIFTMYYLGNKILESLEFNLKNIFKKWKK
jgi:hypothetical protein